MQKSILCYGDSNTWGYMPAPLDQKVLTGRYTRDQRWTGLLQKQLGEDYYIIEEGLNSRTTNIDYHIPPDRNGKTYLPPCLYTHAPIDLVILSLGGNDKKIYFKRTPEMIRDGMADLINTIQTSIYGPGLKKAPQILLLSQTVPLPIIETYRDDQGILVMENAVATSHIVIDLYEQLAKDTNCHYLDISKDVIPSEIDGIHYDLNAHRIVADLIGKKIQSIFK